MHPSDNPSGIATFVGLEHIERDTGVRLGSNTIKLEEMTGRRARFYNGDIVYGYLRPYLNKVWTAEFDGYCSVDQYVLKVRSLADRDYVAHYLRSAEFLKTAPVSTTPGQLPRIRSGEIARTAIPLPPLAEQRRIAVILNQADDLRRKRREASNRLSLLRKGVYRDNFQKKGGAHWQKTELQFLALSDDDIKCGPFGTQLRQSEFQPSGVPLWGIKHVNAGFKLPTVEFLSVAKATELASYDIRPGDIVMTRKGTVGNCAIYPSGFPKGVMHSDLLRLRVDKSKCDPFFVASQFQYSHDVSTQLSCISGGAIMPGINVGRLKTLKIIAPPLELQRTYAASVAEIDKLKAAHRAHLEKLDVLFASLRHRAFRGELD